MIYNDKNLDDIKKFLFKFWDDQKKEGGEVYFDDIVYSILNMDEDDDEDIIRSIWYEYNGGVKKLVQKIRDKYLHDEIEIFGDSNLHMLVFVKDVWYGGDGIFKGLDITFSLINGTADYQQYDEETDTYVDAKNMDIRDIYDELEYDRSDFDDFLRDEIIKNLGDDIKKYGIPYYIEFSVYG